MTVLLLLVQNMAGSKIVRDMGRKDNMHGIINWHHDSWPFLIGANYDLPKYHKDLL